MQVAAARGARAPHHCTNVLRGAHPLATAHELLGCNKHAMSLGGSVGQLLWARDASLDSSSDPDSAPQRVVTQRVPLLSLSFSLLKEGKL